MQPLFSIGLLCFAALVARISIVVLIRYAAPWKFTQAPNSRSSHMLPTPHGGGLAILLSGTLVAVLLTVESDKSIFLSIAVLAFLLGAVGTWDDLRSLPAAWRFAAQIIVVALLLSAYGELPYMHHLLEAIFLFAVLLFFGVWWLNLFNFMDGIDGLAGTQVLFMLGSVLGIAFWQQPLLVSDPVWIWMWCIFLATLVFLLSNWAPAKIFMGNGGSLYLGFMLLVFAALSIEAHWLTYQAWIILVALFVADSSVTLIRRIVRAERFYAAHRHHAYQRLSRLWQSHQAVSLLALTINMLWLLPLAILTQLFPHIAWVAVFLAYIPLALGVFFLGAGLPGDIRKSMTIRN